MTGTLSVGISDEFEDDDWEIAVLDDSGAMAMAVVLKGNNEVAGESLSAYGNDDKLLGRFTPDVQGGSEWR